MLSQSLTHTHDDQKTTSSATVLKLDGGHTITINNIQMVSNDKENANNPTFQLSGGKLILGIGKDKITLDMNVGLGNVPGIVNVIKDGITTTHRQEDSSTPFELLISNKKLPKNFGSHALIQSVIPQNNKQKSTANPTAEQPQAIAPQIKMVDKQSTFTVDSQPSTFKPKRFS